MDLSFVKEGPHSADFLVSALTNSLAPDATTTISVTFKPLAKGTRTASIRIASNDPDENPFVLNFTGSATINSEDSAEPLIAIDTVTVGDAGNADDTTGIGAVGYEFNIGKYEVTIGQYATFLNSVASVTSDSYILDLWNASMATDLNIAGISRSGSGTLGNPYSYSVIGSGNRPITYVSWFDAARFANWMHNGATNGASTETGAYTLNGATNGIITKNAGATWWIPSEDEWYKAAYFKGGGTNAGYWLYPTQSDSAPGNTIGGAANQANYNNGVYAVTQSASYSSTQNYLTDAGAFNNSASAYNTFDQGGNVWEWTDAVSEPSSGRLIRGGSWLQDGYSIGKFGSRGEFDPAEDIAMVGFRLASVPETSTYAQPLVNIETVAVADAGNAGIQTSSGTFGGVSYEYLIGKYEVTIAQYAAFLNSVAAIATDNHLVSLWNSNMATDLNVAGISRSGAGTAEQPFVYTPTNGSSNRPIAYVSWLDAARFANWLHNGATNGASTETGAYTLNGATNGAFSPNPDALWYIPTLNEWFKAAFYKSGSTNAGYWMHPTQSDSQPGNIIGSATNQANYRTWSGYSVTQNATISTNQNYLTDVGAFSGSPSAYGTFDQGGNLREWVFFQDGWGWDDANSQTSGSAGADWNWYFGFISYVTNSIPVEPTDEDQTLGFRVAAVHPSRLRPSIVVEQPVGVQISNDMPAESFGSILVGASSTNRIFTIRNAGIQPLELFQIAKSGLNTNEFLLTPPTTNSLAAGESTTLMVQFTPTLGGSNSAKISIESSDTNNSPFAINLSGFGLGEDLDSDGDGLNDAAEFSMSQLGFDWQTAQEELVEALYQNVGKAGVYTPEQYEANRVAAIAQGRAEVTNNPAAYNLYTTNSIMDLRLNGAMVQKQGETATVVFQPQTTMDLATQPFTDSGPAITNTISMPGDKGFLRIQAKPE
jgi:formylglycine-generating enzyme required for sulfatase activity